MELEKIGLSGGCHWCTEAVFLSLKGVMRVEQGWVSARESQPFSEAVIVHYDVSEADLRILIAVHLHTHSSTGQHHMRNKYRSAVYTFHDNQQILCADALTALQHDFDKPLVTQLLTFQAFHPSPHHAQNYYYKDPRKPFCTTFIRPKMKFLLEQYARYADSAKIIHSDSTVEIRG